MFKFVSWAMLGLAVCATASCSASPDLTHRHFKSKIGVHLIGSYTEGTKKMVRARMPVLKILDTSGDMINAARDYKSCNPDGIVVLRCWSPVNYKLTDNPEQKAQEHWDKIIQPRLFDLKEADRKLIDYVEANNEYDNCPAFATLDDVKWYTRFSIKFAVLCAKNSIKPCLACIPVGNPGGNHDELKAKILAYAPALRAIRKANGVWSYHSYTIQYTTDPKVEIYYSLRYRQFYDFFTGEYADLKNMPMILTEGGVDKGGNKDTDGWQMRGTKEQFENWLKWFDSEIRKDPYIVGITLFENGDPNGWKSFDLEPVADWLAAYWGPAKCR